jgi:hypothetical protein
VKPSPSKLSLLFLLVGLPAFAGTNFSSKNSPEMPLEKKTLVEPASDIPMDEHLEYDVAWMGIPVGTGELWVKEKTIFNGRAAIHIVAIARTNEFLSKIYPVRDEVHSWIDAHTLQSLGARKTVSEGFYRADEQVTFDEAEKKGFYESFKNGSKKAFDIGVPVHDPVSAFYWVRRQPMEPGKVLRGMVNNGEKDYSLEVDVLKHETKEMRGHGVVDVILIEPKSRLEGILEKRGRVRVQLANDPIRTPLVFTFRTPFGVITGALKKAE